MATALRDARGTQYTAHGDRARPLAALLGKRGGSCQLASLVCPRGVAPGVHQHVRLALHGAREHRPLGRRRQHHVVVRHPPAPRPPARTLASVVPRHASERYTSQRQKIATQRKYIRSDKGHVASI
eukprot:4281938-Pyramimonas_sp.AAC.1